MPLTRCSRASSSTSGLGGLGRDLVGDDLDGLLGAVGVATSTASTTSTVPSASTSATTSSTTRCRRRPRPPRRPRRPGPWPWRWPSSSGWRLLAGCRPWRRPRRRPACRPWARRPAAASGAGRPLNFCQSPVILRMASTGSVGCAPTPSQYCARSESTSMTRRLLLRVVHADLLDRPTVTLGAGVGDDDAVVRRADLAQALQLDLDCHGSGSPGDGGGTCHHGGGAWAGRSRWTRAHRPVRGPPTCRDQPHSPPEGTAPREIAGSSV